MNYESQKCIIVAFHPRNAPLTLDCYCGFQKPIISVRKLDPISNYQITRKSAIILYSLDEPFCCGHIFCS